MAEVADTIKDILIVETEPRPGVKQMQPALYFERIKTPYLLATKADLDTLRTAYNVHTIGELIGLRVTIHVTEGRDGQAVLRIKPIRPVAPSATGQQIAQTAEVRVTEDQNNNLVDEVTHAVDTDLQPHGTGTDIATALDTEGNDHAQEDHITPGLQDQKHIEP
jgi:hypothetical protein